MMSCVESYGTRIERHGWVVPLQAQLHVALSITGLGGTMLSFHLAAHGVRDYLILE